MKSAWRFIIIKARDRTQWLLPVWKLPLRFTTYCCILKKEGYKVDGLPASSKELERMIQAQGAVFGTYAEGAFDNFMKNGHPELITKEQYESWVRKVLRPEKYAEVVSSFGEFPGEYMATGDGRLGVARLQFGNVVLLPQNAAGKGRQCV